jgi:hypothetical protein
MSKKLPAQKTGGLYKTNRRKGYGFVEASPSRALRDGEGTFVLNMNDCRYLASRINVPDAARRAPRQF